MDLGRVNIIWQLDLPGDTLLGVRNHVGCANCMKVTGLLVVCKIHVNRQSSK